MTSKTANYTGETREALLSVGMVGGNMVGSIGDPLNPVLVDPTKIGLRQEVGEEFWPIYIFDGSFETPGSAPNNSLGFDGLFGIPNGGLSGTPKVEDNASVANAENATFIDRFLLGFGDGETNSKEALFIIVGLVVLGVIAFNIKRFM